MNKRIRRKLSKRAWDKFSDGIEPTAKEREAALIQFGISMSKVTAAIQDFVEHIPERIARIADVVQKIQEERP